MRIVKCKVGQREELEKLPGFIYCGRRFGDFDASTLGNYVGQGLGKERAIEAYRTWLWKEREGQAAEAWNVIRSLTTNSILGCWCVTKDVAGSGKDQCHCDVIARAWAWVQLHSR